MGWREMYEEKKLEVEQLRRMHSQMSRLAVQRFREIERLKVMNRTLTESLHRAEEYASRLENAATFDEGEKQKLRDRIADINRVVLRKADPIERLNVIEELSRWGWDDD